ncbi:phosphoribosyl-ATP diphosphatase [Azospirillum picis]|uniref:Phosphoribosyl-ATP pyrophosphatase n=1 Tax=Azospirillum picis TaxID=488438 RepID=A0ABU0MG00_9PROT|nr:phosphoribosyl-ATP diphosphatase [Azospirillum picis]MBP2298607.1 phosphoribosyl-ATP pyrophosphohydrolase [Azospirillum picis]MDQ0532344.1 phosphoribosyl-ATP pyrophosphohydrolase [Azospirillum picis]
MVQYIGPDPLRSLYDAVQTLRREPSALPDGSRTAKLLAQGRARMARKVGEEAIEVAIEAMRGDRTALVMEAADLFYNLVVLLADLDISPDEILAELRRREIAFGIAEKLPKSDEGTASTVAPTNGVGKRAKR